MALTKDSPVIQQIVQRIVETVHPLRIVLFGSVARGDARDDSDVDILVVMPEGTLRRGVTKALYLGMRGIGVPVEFIVVTPEELARFKDDIGFIYYDVVREGQDLYAA